MKKKFLILIIVILSFIGLAIPKVGAFERLESTDTIIYYFQHNPSFLLSYGTYSDYYIPNDFAIPERVKNGMDTNGYFYTMFAESAPFNENSESGSSSQGNLKFKISPDPNNLGFYRFQFSGYYSSGNIKLIFRNIPFEENSPLYLYRTIGSSSIAIRYQPLGGDISEFETKTLTETYTEIQSLLPNYGDYEYVEIVYANQYIYYVDKLQENPLSTNTTIIEEVVDLDFAGWIISIFTSFAAFLSIQIGDITIGAILLIPLILSIVFVILKLFRGGGD